LNSEFNVMSAVLTNDVYKRLINPNATDKQLIFVARLNIILVGAIVVSGSLFVGKLGGAFEANKILTGLFAIPLAIPLVLGLLFKKTNPVGAFFTVLVGIFTGLILTLNSDFPWEMATLIQILSCISVFFLSGFLLSSKEKYRKRVDEFFKKIRTPLTPDEIGKSDPKFRFALANLFSVAIAASGILFCAVSIPSIGLDSGKIALGIGCACLILGILLKWFTTGTFSFSNKSIK